MTAPITTTMTNRDFFDANVLVYVYDPRDPLKQQRALYLLTAALANDTGILSAQVLAEFFNAITRKLPAPLSIEEAGQAIARFALMPVVPLDLALVQRAVSLCQRYQISYWDAQIVAAAAGAGCARIISEDLNPGQSYDGVVVVNPFRNKTLPR